MNSIEKLFFILTGNTLYPYQKELLFENARKIIINKSRQIGITLTYSFYAVLNALRGKKIVVISPSERQSLNFFDYAKKLYFNFVDEFKRADIILDVQPLILQSGYVLLSNGGSIRSLPNSPSTIRGLVADILIFDEMAHIENDIECWSAAYPMISRGEQLICVSTPNGEANLYADIWKNAEKMGFKKILLNYRDCPDFTEDKIKELKKSLDDLSWRQEYENEFLGTINAYFTINLINNCIQDINCFEYPEQIDEKLIFGVDIGRKTDKTAIVGINQKGEIKFIKTLENKTFEEQEKFIESLVQKASLIKIDMNGIGMPIVEKLQQKYPSIIQGITITNDVKLNGFMELRRKMEQKEITLPNNFELKRALNLIERKQLGTTITFDAQRTDETGHSDLAFALMLAIYDKNIGTIKIAQKGW